MVRVKFMSVLIYYAPNPYVFVSFDTSFGSVTICGSSPITNENPLFPLLGTPLTIGKKQSPSHNPYTHK